MMGLLGSVCSMGMLDKDDSCPTWDGVKQEGARLHDTQNLKLKNCLFLKFSI